LIFRKNPNLPQKHQNFGDEKSNKKSFKGKMFLKFEPRAFLRLLSNGIFMPDFKYWLAQRQSARRHPT